MSAVPVTIGIDIGGSGSRAQWLGDTDSEHTAAQVAQVASAGAHRIDGPRLSVNESGANHTEVVSWLLRTILAERGADPDAARAVKVVAVGAASITSLAEHPRLLGETIRHLCPNAAYVVTSDAITSTVGALGERGGVVVAAGTGAITMSTDGADQWHRVDGWGHVLGDAGSGAWLGARALTAALEQFDGRRTDAASLLDALTARFGSPPVVPRLIYTNPERAGVLASFVPDVLASAATGDPLALRLCSEAGEALARSAIAALKPGVPERVAALGGILGHPGPIVDAFAASLRSLRPAVRTVAPRGDSLVGALLLGVDQQRGGRRVSGLARLGHASVSPGSLRG